MAAIADLLLQVEGGETVVVARDGTPVVQITQIAKDVEPVLSRSAGLGMFRGVSKISEDIRTPFAEQIDAMFYGNADQVTP